jgi:hypothetical protein
LGMTFANFLDLGVPHSQPKRKLINISGERGHFTSEAASIGIRSCQHWNIRSCQHWNHFIR